MSPTGFPAETFAVAAANFCWSVAFTLDETCAYTCRRTCSSSPPASCIACFGWSLAISRSTSSILSSQSLTAILASLQVHPESGGNLAAKGQLIQVSIYSLLPCRFITDALDHAVVR